MDILFPQNPTDGQIYEAAPGVVYKYSLATNSWLKIVRPQIPLATHTAAGLMSKEDFKKLTGIILPPPRCSITSEDCAADEKCADKLGTVIDSGYIAFQGDGIINFEVSAENIHENTGLVNVTLNVDRLVEKLKELGRFRMTAAAGDQGEQGETGDAGLDSLPVGPYGKDGEPGAPVEWPGAIVEEGLNIKDDNRAVVNITTQEVSEDENYLVVERANIGNPDACPDTIKPKDIQSPWMLGFSSAAVTTVRKITSDGKLVCARSCNSDIYYFNMDSIVRTIRNHFVEYLRQEKRNREQYVSDVLDDMITQFDEQKAALCCALERCRSKTRNAEARKYIESQKIQAAQGGYNINVGDPSQGAGYKPDFYENCGDYDTVKLDDPEKPLK